MFVESPVQLPAAVADRAAVYTVIHPEYGRPHYVVFADWSDLEVRAQVIAAAEGEWQVFHDEQRLALLGVYDSEPPPADASALAQLLAEHRGVLVLDTETGRVGFADRGFLADDDDAWLPSLSALTVYPGPTEGDARAFADHVRALCSTSGGGSLWPDTIAPPRHVASFVEQAIPSMGDELWAKFLARLAAAASAVSLPPRDVALIVGVHASLGQDPAWAARTLELGAAIRANAGVFGAEVVEGARQLDHFALGHLARARERAGDIDGALAAWRQVLTDGPTGGTRCTAELAALELRLPSLSIDEALSEASALVEPFAKDAGSDSQRRLMALVAQLHEARGDWAAAVDWHRRALEASGHLHQLEALSRLCARLGEAERAFRFAKAAVDGGSADPACRQQVEAWIVAHPEVAEQVRSVNGVDLARAVQAGDADAVTRCLAAGVSVEVPLEFEHWTWLPLDGALRAGRPSAEVVRRLCEAGARPTPEAERSCDDPSVLAVLAAHAVPLALDGSRLVGAAANSGALALTAFLLDHGTPVDARAEGGETALMRAAGNGCTRQVRLLLEHGADPDLTDAGGQRAVDRDVTEEIRGLLSLHGRDGGATRAHVDAEVGRGIAALAGWLARYQGPPLSAFTVDEGLLCATSGVPVPQSTGDWAHQGFAELWSPHEDPHYTLVVDAFLREVDSRLTELFAAHPGVVVAPSRS